MQCLACGGENREGARFCAECGTELAAPLSCPACGAQATPGQRFCDACGQRLGEAERAGGRAAPDPVAYMPEHLADKIRTAKGAIEGERKQVTVLFADVQGSMALAGGVDPEDWRAVMDRLFAIMCDGVHRFEGTVNKFTGDGIMALFGAPIAHEDDPQRACYAALHLADELARYAAELRRSRGLNFSVRMGLNTGEVVVGTIGDDLRLDYTAIGNTVGLAQRMESLAEPGNAYLTEHTAALVEGYFRLRDLGRFEVKGVREPVGVHQLEGVGALRSRLERSRARGFSQFVGRDREMSVLESGLERAIEDEAQVIGVVSDAGVGKSRLCYEFLERCRAREIDVWEAHCLAHATAVPFVPVLEILRGYFGITEQDSDLVAREKIAGRLLLLDERFTEALPLVFDFLGVPDPDRPVPRMDPEARQRQLFAALNRLRRARSEQAPGVILIEDLHWIDAGSEAFLEDLVETLSGTRTLVVVNFRPDYHASWMQRSYYQQLPLLPLGREATGALLEDLLGADPSLDGLAEVIQERTGGNPFFVEEVVQGLVESRSLEGERGGYRLVHTIGEIAIPATVQAVLAARIDRLPEREKALLQTASVIGREFSEPVLSRVAELPEDELAAGLRGLVAGEFLYERALYPEAEYAFKHPLTEEVAYRSQLAERRAQVHGAVARTIAEVYPDKLDERAGLLAHHLERAGEQLGAAHWSARAAAWAGFTDPSEAVRNWRKVRDLTDAAPGSPEAASLGLTARIFMLQFAWRVGAYDEEEQARVLAEGKELAERSADKRSLAFLIASYANTRGMGGEVGEYVELSLEALRLAEETGDEAVDMSVRPVAIYSLFVIGRLREALAHAERGIELGSRDPSLGAGVAVGSPYSWCMFFRGFLRALLGDLTAGERDLDRALELTREHGDVESMGWTHMQYVNLGRYNGDLEMAIAHARRSVEIAERIGHSFSRGWAYNFLGLAHAERREWPEAAQAEERALQISREARTGLEGKPMKLATLGLAYAGMGEAERAGSAVRDAVRLSRRRGTLYSELLGQTYLARVLLTTDPAGARDEVEAALSRALEIARQIGAKSEEPFVHLALAELAELTDDASARERELAEAQRLFAEIGAPRKAAVVESQLAAP